MPGVAPCQGWGRPAPTPAGGCADNCGSMNPEKRCYWDPTCSDRNSVHYRGGLGCHASSLHVNCRWCWASNNGHMGHHVHEYVGCPANVVRALHPATLTQTPRPLRNVHVAAASRAEVTRPRPLLAGAAAGSRRPFSCLTPFTGGPSAVDDHAKGGGAQRERGRRASCPPHSRRRHPSGPGERSGLGWSGNATHHHRPRRRWLHLPPLHGLPPRLLLHAATHRAPARDDARWLPPRRRARDEPEHPAASRTSQPGASAARASRSYPDPACTQPGRARRPSLDCGGTAGPWTGRTADRPVRGPAGSTAKQPDCMGRGPPTN